MTDLAEGTTDTQRNIKARNHFPGEPSMWFFVIGDLFIFGVYFVAYMYYRGQD
ncbi:MAG: cytochrome c oxidase subunit 3 family protein, partial [Mycobacterium sp.]